MEAENKRPICSVVLNKCLEYNAKTPDKALHKNCKEELGNCKDLEFRFRLQERINKKEKKFSVFPIFNEPKNAFERGFLSDPSYIFAFIANRSIRRSLEKSEELSDVQKNLFQFDKMEPVSKVSIDCNYRNVQVNAKTLYDHYNPKLFSQIQQSFQNLGEKTKLFLLPSGTLFFQGQQVSGFLAPMVLEEREEGIEPVPENKTGLISMSKFQKWQKLYRLKDMHKFCDLIQEENSANEPKPECAKKWEACLTHNKQSTEKRNCKQELRECKDYEDFYKLRKTLRRIGERVSDEELNDQYKKYGALIDPSHIYLYFATRLLKNPNAKKDLSFLPSANTKARITHVLCDPSYGRRRKSKAETYIVSNTEGKSVKLSKRIFDNIAKIFRHKEINQPNTELFLENGFNPVLVKGRRYSAVIAPIATEDENEPLISENDVAVDIDTFNKIKKQVKSEDKVCDAVFQNMQKTAQKDSSGPSTETKST